MTKWTAHDTAICERAEASGLALNSKTSKPLTFTELQELAKAFDQIRDKVTVDEFLKDKITSIPFNFQSE
jgi:hypothetical protein